MNGSRGRKASYKEALVLANRKTGEKVLSERKHGSSITLWLGQLTRLTREIVSVAESLRRRGLLSENGDAKFDAFLY